MKAGGLTHRGPQGSASQGSRHTSPSLVERNKGNSFGGSRPGGPGARPHSQSDPCLLCGWRGGEYFLLPTLGHLHTAAWSGELNPVMLLLCSKLSQAPMSSSEKEARPSRPPTALVPSPARACPRAFAHTISSSQNTLPPVSLPCFHVLFRVGSTVPS